MVLAGGKKNVRIVLVVFYFLCLSYILVVSSLQMNGGMFSGLREWTRFKEQKGDERIMYNRLEEGRVQMEVVEKDLSSPLNMLTNELYDKKIKNDIEDRLFVLDTQADFGEINVPSYYLTSTPGSKDFPEIQPFDSRFTLGIYYNHIKRSLMEHPTREVVGPFSWYDWLDYSTLNKYLLASNDEKPTCAILDPSTNLKDYSKDKVVSNEKIRNSCTDDDKDSDGKYGKLRTGFNVHSYAEERMSQDQAIIAGKSYLYNNAPPPSRLIFLTSRGAYNMTVNKDESLLRSTLVHDYLEDTRAETVNVIKEFKELKNAVKPNEHKVLDQYEIKLTHEMFVYDAPKILDDLEKKVSMGTSMSKMEGDYYNSVLYSLDSVDHGGPPKYFSEARLHGTTLGDHYDWRFFNGVIQKSFQQSLVLHRLVRVWLSFCRKNAISTWVAHGSLLSWYWNGVTFPWDFDIDVQMPIMDLHKLSLDFNQSLVVEDAEDGMGRYFLDCGSFITLREKGNGNNNIDARFIDLDTGLYIDITGLALSNTRPPDRYTASWSDGWEKGVTDYTDINTELEVYNCRNKHFSSLSELSPLRKSSIEGEIGYIPNKFPNLLQVEYHTGMSKKFFKDYVFLPQLRLWVKTEELFNYIFSTPHWNLVNNYEKYESEILQDETIYDKILEHPNVTQEYKDTFKELSENKKITELDKVEVDKEKLEAIFNLPDDLLVGLLSNDDIFISYYTTREFTAFHKMEMDLLLASKSTEALVTPSPNFKPMLYDPFSFKIINDNIDYSFEVEKLTSLLHAYTHSDQAIV